MDVQIAPSWKSVLQDEFDQPYFGQITQRVKQDKAAGKIIYPPGSKIFNAFEFTPFENVKVVILGQDPYHGAGQAHGLCFSVPYGVKPPPSLVNIYRELKADFPDFIIPNHGNLEQWAKQGVFLLNAILTVQAGTPTSHSKIGWETFTNAIILKLSSEKDHLVFMLWGSFAKSKAVLIDESRHLVLLSGHPSFADSHKQFFGNHHFRKCNEYLAKYNKGAINWQI